MVQAPPDRIGGNILSTKRVLRAHNDCKQGKRRPFESSRRDPLARGAPAVREAPRGEEANARMERAFQQDGR
jgi:hypothetical protein